MYLKSLSKSFKLLTVYKKYDLLFFQHPLPLPKKTLQGDSWLVLTNEQVGVGLRSYILT